MKKCKPAKYHSAFMKSDKIRGLIAFLKNTFAAGEKMTELRTCQLKT